MAPPHRVGEQGSTARRVPRLALFSTAKKPTDPSRTSARAVEPPGTGGGTPSSCTPSSRRARTRASGHTPCHTGGRCPGASSPTTVVGPGTGRRVQWPCSWTPTPSRAECRQATSRPPTRRIWRRRTRYGVSYQRYWVDEANRQGLLPRRGPERRRGDPQCTARPTVWSRTRSTPSLRVPDPAGRQRRGLVLRRCPTPPPRRHPCRVQIGRHGPRQGDITIDPMGRHPAGAAAHSRTASWREIGCERRTERPSERRRRRGSAGQPFLAAAGHRRPRIAGTRSRADPLTFGRAG